MAGAVAKHYTVARIKQKLMRPAQTSVYIVQVQTNPDVNRFVASAGRDYSPQKHEEMINMACCEASLPGSSLATHEVNNDYHGATEKMAYRRIYDDSIDLTFYVDHEYAVIKYFQGWMNYIVGEGSYFSGNDYRDPTTFYRMTYPSKYKSNIFLTKFEKDVSKNHSKPTLKYEFIQAFPINMVSIPVSYESSELLKLTVSFSYTRYVMNGGFGFYSENGSASPYLDTDTANLYSSTATDPATQAAYNRSAFEPGATGLDMNYDWGSSLAFRYSNAMPETFVSGYTVGENANVG